ncbi:MAG: hypothetical protein RIT45_3761 [Pseudomonadota bacterium]|jgi:probable rRNA maturation factor
MPVHIDTDHPRLRVPVRRLGTHLRYALTTLGRPKAVVEVALVDDAAIAELNAEWRGVEGVTDVLSFALEEGEPMPGAEELLGDIVISLDTAQRQADAMTAFLVERGETGAYGLFEEVAFLATHGLLHLLGHDHQESAEAEAMEALERELIAAITTAPVHALDRTDHAL